MSNARIFWCYLQYSEHGDFPRDIYYQHWSRWISFPRYTENMRMRLHVLGKFRFHKFSMIRVRIAYLSKVYLIVCLATYIYMKNISSCNDRLSGRREEKRGWKIIIWYSYLGDFASYNIFKSRYTLEF